MARRAAGPAGPLHSAQDHAPGERGAGHRAATSPSAAVPAAPRAAQDDADDLERLRETLLHGRAAHARPPLRVEDPVHLPPGPGRAGGWAGGWPAARPEGRPDDAVDPDGLAGGESPVMHPDDLAALHALPTTTAETRAWAGAGAGTWAGRAPERAAREAQGEHLVGTAQGLSLWEDDRSWDEGSPWADDARAVGLLHQRWLQLTVCALLALVVGAALALLLTGGQVDAARAEADLQRQAASSARADLVRERAARASEQPAGTVPAPPPAPAPPPSPPAPLAPPQAPATGVDPAVVAPPPPTDRQRPPVAEAPAPTADPGPPPPGPSPAATATSAGQGSPAPSPARSSPQDTAAQGPSTAPPEDLACPQAPDGAGGDGPATCP